MCPRGQFVHVGLSDDPDIFSVCTGQDNAKCADRCFNRIRGGMPGSAESESQFLEQRIADFVHASRAACNSIGAFFAPSPHLARRFVDEFGLDRDRVHQFNYGFDRTRLAGRTREPPGPNNPVVFGFAGRHIAVKGIHHLIEAFSGVEAPPGGGPLPQLVIWGRDNGQVSAHLRRLAAEAGAHVADRIEFRPEYANERVIADVLNHCDAMVVPSIWDENSPLVIHEAAQARVPVITADHGGMADYVTDGRNGILFPFRSVDGLRGALQRMVNDPIGAAPTPGYLHSDDGNTPDIADHVDLVVQHYKALISQEAANESVPQPPTSASVASITVPDHDDEHPLAHRAAPWRITFDTNPDDCNFSCIMCEEHSPFSPKQQERVARGDRRRRMDINLIRDVVTECASRGLREIIPTTMGEPLMYKGMLDIVDLCEEFDVKLNLTTNGSFNWPGRRRSSPKSGATLWAERIVPVASDVKISWNGASPGVQEKVMQKSSWEKQNANLKDFLSVRDRLRAEGRIGPADCTVTLQVTFMEVNLAEFPMLVQMAAALGIERIKGHQLWAHFAEIEGQDLRRSRESRARWNACVAQCHSVAEECRLPKTGAAIRLENFDLLDLDDGDTSRRGMAADSVCPFLGQEAWVHYDGRFDPCCAPDEQRKTLGIFGNVNDAGLLSVWTSDKYKSLVKNYTDKPLCATCNMRRPIPTAHPQQATQ